MKAVNEKQRCIWAQSDALMQKYHDEEWGVPEYGSQALWEKLMLDGFQAGLSWKTILHKRDAFRKGFANFDPQRVARFEEKDIMRLMEDAGIVRSRAKIEATIGGARAYLQIENEGRTFSDFVWEMVGGKPVRNKRQKMSEIPTKTELSEKLSKELKKRGFKFVGPVIVYAWMQATGMVDDHIADCFRYHSKP